MRNFIISITVITSVFFSASHGEARQVVEERGGGRVKVVKYADGTWQLFVENKPYFIKGVLFNPVKIGESPDEATMRDWMLYDDNRDGENDIAYQTWVDKNRNNKKDADEEIKGDFQLLKEMGCNTIRLYHIPSDNPLLGNVYTKSPSTAIQFNHPVNKKLLRELYRNYGIMVLMSNFMGSWTIGSSASWESGTDYTNPRHCENIKKSVKAMVLDNKDEPYVLMWVLGNENNIATWSRCNAKEKPEAYAKLIDEMVQMIHKLDPEHPVAVCDGDNFNTLKEYAKYAADVDIIAYNAYRDEFGFGSLWKESKRIFDRPIFISEFGMFAYNTKTGEDEDLQLKYLKSYWRDIVHNSTEYYIPGGNFTGNSLGGVIFSWLDRWYMDGSPSRHNPGTKTWNSPDGLSHEEWFGILSTGNGHDWLMREERKSYNYFKDVWNRDKLSYK